MAYGDCCMDFEESCPDEFAASISLRRHFKYRKTKCQRVRVALNKYGLRRSKDLTFVAVCGQTGYTCNSTSPYDLLEPNLAVPVTDTDSGVTYINYKCAQCNGVRNVTPWSPIVSRVPRFQEDDSFKRKSIIDTKEKLIHFLNSTCETNYFIPENVTIRENPKCREFIEKCPPTCKNAQLVDLCEKSYTVNYVNSPKHEFKTISYRLKDHGEPVYRNIYCALCSGESVASMQCEEPFNFPSYGPGGVVKILSFSVLLDFDPSEGLTVGRRTRPALPQCPEDMRLVGGKCQPSNIYITLSAFMFFKVTSDLKVTLQYVSILNNSFRNHLNDILKDEGTAFISLNQTENSDTCIELILGINIQLRENSTFDIESNLTTFLNKAKDTFYNDLVSHLYQANINIHNVVITVEDKPIPWTLLLNCTWLQFSHKEFNTHNDTLVLKSNDKSYLKDTYRLVEDGALVCIDHEEISDVEFSSSTTLGILTIFFTSLSILCLTVRLVLQRRIQYYNTFPGKLHFNLCLALCLAFLMLLISGVVSLYDVKLLCVACGVLMYWFFMAAFCWMTAVTVHSWLTFKPSAMFQSIQSQKKTLMFYAVPCWLLPAIIAVTVACLDFSNIGSMYKPEFGTNLCWFNQRYALLLYFGVPVAFLLFLTTIFFMLTVLNLRKTSTSHVRKSSDRESHQVKIYFRLFVLIGVTWIIGFVAAFVHSEALWIVFITLNASQGIFIFVSFVLRRQVLRQIFPKVKPPSSSGTIPMGSVVSENQK